MTDARLRTFKSEQRLKALDLFKQWNVDDTQSRALLGNMDARNTSAFVATALSIWTTS